MFNPLMLGVITSIVVAAAVFAPKLITTQTLTEKASGTVWMRQWFLGLPLRAEIRHAPKVLTFPHPQGGLPEIAMSTASLPITQDGVVIQSYSVETAVTAVQFALTGLCYCGYIRFVRVVVYSGWFRSRPPRTPKRVYLVERTEKPIVLSEIAGSLERLLSRYLPNPNFLISLDDLLDKLVVGVKDAPANDLVASLIDNAIIDGVFEPDNNPRTGWQWLVRKIPVQVRPHRLEMIKQERQKANQIWKVVFDQERELAWAIADATRSVMASHTDSGY